MKIIILSLLLISNIAYASLTAEETITHYNILKRKLADSKRNWQISVNADCLMEAYVYEKNSYAFFSTKYSCLIDRYRQRIDYYHDFDFM